MTVEITPDLDATWSSQADAPGSGAARRFYSEARDWDLDRQLRLERSERRAWKVAFGALGVSVLLTATLVALMPLKQAVPYVLAVDRATGNVEVLNIGNLGSLTPYRELLDLHWAQKYVIARESYQWRLLQSDYDLVLSMSNDPVGREYAGLYEGPNARDKKFGPDTEMKVEIISVTPPPDSQGRAVVRFAKTVRRPQTNTSEPPQYFVATLAFEYKSSMFGKLTQLLQNPAGFRVTAYRVDAETTPPGAGS